jgi:putative hydrolase of the HAD superfamily
VSTKTLVFDLDDTLYPERDYARSGLRAAGAAAERQFGIQGLGEIAIALFNRGRRGDIFQEALRQVQWSDVEAAVPAMIRAYRHHSPSIRLYPDVEEVLPRLRRFGRLALITDGYLPPQQLKVQALGVESFFDPIIYTEQLGRHCWKPAEQAFISLEQTCSAAATDCVYVADNPRKDFIAPRKRGWVTIRIKRPDTEHEKASGEHDAQCEMRDFRDLERWLGGI